MFGTFRNPSLMFRKAAATGKFVDDCNKSRGKNRPCSQTKARFPPKFSAIFLPKNVATENLSDKPSVNVENFAGGVEIVGWEMGLI